MIYLLCFGILYLAGTFLVLIRNRYEFKSLKNSSSVTESEAPFVSICIPARNEEENIEHCVTSALKQDYEHFEVLVLDDNSTDGTTEILQQLSGIISNLRHIQGTPKPDDWHGKPWACQQLAEQAKGDILLFIDADVWIEPDALQKTVHELGRYDMITVWPQQILKSFWENMIVPMVYFALLTLLPSTYVERSPRWLPDRFKKVLAPEFAAACGQFMAYNRSVLEHIGNFQKIKQAIVDDVEMAKILKTNGYMIRMFSGIEIVYCRMYTGHQEIWNGFKKNFLAGFGSIPLFLMMAVIHVIVFLLPLYAFIYSWYSGFTDVLLLSGSALFLILVQRAILNKWFNWNPVFILLHPISVLWFQILGVVSLINHSLGRKNTWKDRDV